MLLQYTDSYQYSSIYTQAEVYVHVTWADILYCALAL